MRHKQSVRLYQSHVQSRHHSCAFCATERFIEDWSVSGYRFTILPWFLQLHSKHSYDKDVASLSHVITYFARFQSVRPNASHVWVLADGWTIANIK